MINLWLYEYCGMVRIIDIDGREFIGKALEVTDEGERSEDEVQEIGITIATETAEIEFLLSEIKSIEKIKS